MNFSNFLHLLALALASLWSEEVRWYLHLRDRK